MIFDKRLYTPQEVSQSGNGGLAVKEACRFKSVVYAEVIYDLVTEPQLRRQPQAKFIMYVGLDVQKNRLLKGS